MGEPARDDLQRSPGPDRIGLRPGRPQPAQHERPLRLGQVVGHVALLVPSAALHRGAIAEDPADGGAQRLATVDDEEDARRRVEAALAQVGDEARDDGRVLGRALGDSEGDLGPVGRHPERAHEQVVAHPEAVEIDDQEALLAQGTRQQLGEAPGGGRHEAARDR